jgi:Ca-activated chloride channel family protein
MVVPRLPLALSLIVAALLGASAAAQTGQGQEVRPAMPSFKSSATQVAVTAAVRQANGTPVTTLKRDDFVILDNGAPRAISSFWFEPSAASVVVLFDRSGSMRLGNKIEIGRDAARQLLGWLDNGVDQVSLLGFDRDVSRLQPFEPVPGHLIARLEHVDAFGTTALLDAMATAANEVTSLRTRRAVVVLTDGLDTGSHATALAVSHIAAGIDVPVYVIITTPAVDRNVVAAREADLARLARSTGGEAFVVTTANEAMLTTRMIASDLHHQYLMTFASDGAPGWHALDVRVKQQKLLVRARTGYDAGVRPTSE